MVLKQNFFYFYFGWWIFSDLDFFFRKIDDLEASCLFFEKLMICKHPTFWGSSGHGKNQKISKPPQILIILPKLIGKHVISVTSMLKVLRHGPENAITPIGVIVHKRIGAIRKKLYFDISTFEKNCFLFLIV